MDFPSRCQAVRCLSQSMTLLHAGCVSEGCLCAVASNEIIRKEGHRVALMHIVALFAVTSGLERLAVNLDEQVRGRLCRFQARPTSLQFVFWCFLLFITSKDCKSRMWPFSSAWRSNAPDIVLNFRSCSA